MTAIWRGGLLLTSALILSACTRDGGVSSYLAGGCTDSSQQQFEKVDWEKVRTVKMRIRQGEYSPMVVNLTQNQPYIMRIENADDDNRVFRASKFFQSVAMAKASIGKETYLNDCIDAVSLDAGEVAELRFIAVRDGRYDFEDNSLLLALSSLGGASGSISIQPKRVNYTPPINLRIKEPETRRMPLKLPPGQQPITPSPSVPVDRAPDGGGLFGPPPAEAKPEPGDGLFGAPEPEAKPEPKPQPGEGLFGAPEPEAKPEAKPAPKPEVKTAPAPAQPPEEETPVDEPTLGEPNGEGESDIEETPAVEAEPTGPTEPHDDIFGEPIEIEPGKPGEDLYGKPTDEAPKEPDDDIFGEPIEQQSMA